MNYIVLDPQQVASLSQSSGSLEARVPDGTVVGFFVRQRPTEATPITNSSYEFSAEEIAEATRRMSSDSPCLTTQQVLEHLRSLEG